MSKRTEKAAAENACPWEEGVLGGSVEHAKPVSNEHASAVDDALGLQMISIRLQKSLIDDLKYLAEREGLGYQPLIRRVLCRYVAFEYKSIAREQFARDGQSSNALPPAEDECGDVRMAAYG